MSQIAVLSGGGGGGAGTVVSLTGNAGGAVGPSIGGNINVIGASGINIVGTPGTNTLTASNSLGLGRFPITPFVVGPVGLAGYQTIQTAINAAHAAGKGSVWVMPGTYTENLTFYNDCDLVGANANSYFNGSPSTVTIIGTHIPPTTGTLNVRNIFFQSATHVFNSAAAGTASIALEYCNLALTNGYTFNLPNWTGAFYKSSVEDSSANNGIVNNTGGALVYIQNSNARTSSTNPMITSGPTIIKRSEISCPWTAGAGTAGTVDRSIFNVTITTSGDASLLFSFVRISSGAGPAYTHSTTSNVTLTSCIIDSNNTPAISGSGAGTLNLCDCSFLGDATISGTLPALVGASGYMPGDFGTASQVLTSNGPGVLPTFQAANTNLIWIDAINASYALAIKTGYVTDRGGGVTYTLPATAAQGDIIEITGKLGIAVIAQNANQQICIGNAATTVGVTGSLTATDAGDCLKLKCITAGASTIWRVTSSMGNWNHA